MENRLRVVLKRSGNETILNPIDERVTPSSNYSGNAWEGSNYKLGLDIAEIAKHVRRELKKQYPKCTFSVRIERYAGGRSLNVRLMAGPFEAITCEYRKDHTKAYPEFIKEPVTKQCSDINEYTLSDGYDSDNHRPTGMNNGVGLTRQAWDCMAFVKTLCNSFNFDDSDIQSDYFHTNFYLHLGIGQWDKPYTVKG